LTVSPSPGVDGATSGTVAPADGPTDAADCQTTANSRPGASQ
jgi:hypothetical protein